MGVVTAVRRNVKNASRCSVFVDDEFLAEDDDDADAAMRRFFDADFDDDRR